MKAKEFEARILELIPGAAPEAMRSWIAYAEELDRDGTHPADCFFDEMVVELDIVKKHGGDEIARLLFDTGKTFTLNPFEIRGAANLLKDGMAMEDVCQQAVDGFCDRTPQEWEESDKALEILRKARCQENTLPEQVAPDPLQNEQAQGLSLNQQM